MESWVTNGSTKWECPERPSMQSLLVELIQSIIDMPGRFIEIALFDPLSAILILIGAVFVGVSSAVFGYLTVGAAVSLVMRPGSGQSPPPQEAQ